MVEFSKITEWVQDEARAAGSVWLHGVCSELQHSTDSVLETTSHRQAEKAGVYSLGVGKVGYSDSNPRGHKIRNLINPIIWT